MKKFSFIALLLFVVVLPAFSHEGHGHISSNNPLHYLAEPLHALTTVVALGVISYVVYRFYRARNQR